MLTKREGMGSSGQVFNAEFWISDLTSLSGKVLKADNVGIAIALLLTVIDATGTDKSAISASICLRMVSNNNNNNFIQLIMKFTVLFVFLVK